MIETFWGPRQRAAAHAEGWDLFEGNGGFVQIQIMDGEEVMFFTDEAAIKHVDKMAHIDSPVHLRALLTIALSNKI